MSHLRFGRERKVSASASNVSSTMPDTHHIKIELVPIPVETNEFDPKKVQAQTTALKDFRTAAKDLFETNDCRLVTNGGTRAYQTQETYGTAVSMEKAIEVMTAHDLTFKINFRRPGVHGSTTCMELSSPLLERLLQESEDAKGMKTIELRCRSETHGSMYVSVSKTGAQHVLSHVDYHILSQYDEMYN
jgi:hypothetical protein